MFELLLKKFQNIWMTGIGGSGMNGIAEVLIQMGFNVSGSDMTRSDVTDRLLRLGASIYIGHNAKNIKGSDILVYSSAIRPDNIELIAAHELKIPAIRRAEMLAEFLRMKPGIAISGTHGKTTVTSLVGEVLTVGKLAPTVIAGGRLKTLGGGAVSGKGDLIVVEADEYDKSFFQLSPLMVLLNNIDDDHRECYGSYADIEDAFVRFANSVPFYGLTFICLDEPSLHPVLPRLRRNVITYGFSPQADIKAKDAVYTGFKSNFKVEIGGVEKGTVGLPLPGIFNVRNALGAIAIGNECNVSFDKIKSALENFRGVHRRFEILGEVDGIMVVSDFGHHPTAISATLAGARAGWSGRRIIAIFQAHLYSRTQWLAQQFGQSLLGADKALVLPIYPAREDPIPGVTGKLIYDAARDFGHKDVEYIENRDEVVDRVCSIVKKGDIVIVIGAGTVGELAPQIYTALQAR